MILFNNFKAQYQFLKNEIDSAVQSVFNRGWFILGEEVQSFENEFAKFVGTEYCVGVASGTDAITLSLMALDIGNNHEVITTNMTAFPTITGILRSGATPVVVDIFSKDGLIDYAKIPQKITAKTRAIVPVHLYGQSCNMDAILEIAKQYKLKIVEDCAQAAGAKFKTTHLGAFGNCGAFSFYPTKNLGAFGDGGAITTNDKTLYNNLTQLRNYGQSTRYLHDSPGINSRLDEIQAAILRVKLKYLNEWNEQRYKIAQFYRSNLTSVECLNENNNCAHIYHLFVVKSSNRQRLLDHLKINNIQALIHYPVAINEQKAFLMQKDELFANSKIFADSILSLPIYPELTLDELDKIVRVINEHK